MHTHKKKQPTVLLIIQSFLKSSVRDHTTISILYRVYIVLKKKKGELNKISIISQVKEESLCQCVLH